MRGILVLLWAVQMLAGPPPGPGRPNVHVPMWVGRAEGEEQPVLTSKELSATLDGKQVRVKRVLGPNDDLVLLIVTDVAGDITLADTAKAALIERIQQMPPRVSVGLLRAQDGPRVLADPTADRAAIATAIRSVAVSGRAALLDTIETVAGIGDSMLAKAAVRVAVLYVTDSEIANYREDLTNPVINQSDTGDMSRRFPDALVREKISKIETALRTMETPVFILHLSYLSRGLNEAYQAGLMRLAAATGGSSIFCRSQAEIPDGVARMFESIVSFSSVEVQLPAQAPPAFDIGLDSPGRTLTYRSRFAKQ